MATLLQEGLQLRVVSKGLKWAPFENPTTLVRSIIECLLRVVVVSVESLKIILERIEVQHSLWFTI